MLALKENNFGRARQLLNRQRPSSGEADLRCWEWRLLWQQCQGDVLFKLPRHGNSVNALAFCSDSRLLASGDWDGIIRIHEVGTGRETQRMKDADPVRGLKFIHGDTQLISGGSQISIWDVKSGEGIDSIELSARCRAFDVAPDDSTFAAITTNHKAVIGDLATRKLLAEFPTKNIYGDHPGQIAYSRDSQQVAIGDLDGTLKIIAIPSLKPVQEFEAHRIGITALAFSPDGRQIATSAGYSSQAIRLWDVETGELQSEKAGHTEWVSSLAYTDDGKKLFSTSADQTVRVWDVAGDAPTKTLRGHELEVWSIATSPNKQLFASGGKDGTVHLWTQNAETHDVPYVTSSIPLKDAQFFGDSKRILVLKNDNTIAIWDTATLQEKELLTELGNDNTAIHMSPDSRWCLAVTRNLDIKVYEFKRESIITRLSAQSPAAEITVLADGKTLAVSDPGSIRFWSTDTWDQVREFSMAGPQRPLIVSPSGKLGGYASGGRVHLWDIEANKRIGKKQAHKRGGHFAFSHDSKLMASVSNDGSMGMWTTDESMSSNGPLSGHLKGVHSVLFTPDNSRLVTGSGDHEIIRLWDIATNEQVATLSGEGYLVYQLRCSLDGNALAAINSEGKLHVWRPPTWEEIQAKERLAISR